MGNFVGKDQITVSSTSKEFTASNIPRTTVAGLVSVRGASVVMGDDANDPTAVEGVTLHHGATFVLVGRQNILNVRFIRYGAIDAAVDIRCFSTHDVPVVVQGELSPASQTRNGHHKYTRAQISKTTAAEEDIVSWTVTAGKRGYVAHISASILSHASETLHILKILVNGVAVAQKRWAQGDRDVEFHIPIPHSVGGSQIIKLTAEQATTNTSAYNGNIIGWEEDEI